MSFSHINASSSEQHPFLPTQRAAEDMTSGPTTDVPLGPSTLSLLDGTSPKVRLFLPTTSPKIARLAFQVLWLCLDENLQKQPAVTRTQLSNVLLTLTQEISVNNGKLVPLLPASSHALFTTLAAEKHGVDALTSALRDVAQTLASDASWLDSSTTPCFPSLTLCVVLMHALDGGVADAVAVLREVGASITAPGDDGSTVLLFASKAGHVPLVKELLAAGAVVDASTVAKGDTPLLVAVEEHHTGVARLLLEAKADVEQSFSHELVDLPSLDVMAEGWTVSVLNAMIKNSARVTRSLFNRYSPLLTAADRGYLGLVQVLVAAGADIEARDKFSNTPLLAAARRGFAKVMRFLINAGANVHARNKEGETAVFYAAHYGRVKVLRALLAAGAAVDAKDNYGCTPLIKAMQLGRTGVVRVLLSAGANACARNTRGELELASMSDGIKQIVVDHVARTPRAPWNGLVLLCEAAMEGDEALTRMILQKKVVDVNEKGLQGVPPLLWAAEEDWASVVQMLVEAGAKVDVRDEQGRTVLMSVARSGYEAVVEVLLSAGAATDAVDEAGWSAVMHAVAGKHPGVLQLLVRAGADVDLGTRKRETPLSHALSHCHSELVRVLVEAGASLRLPDGRDVLWVLEKQRNSRMVAVVKEAQKVAQARVAEREGMLLRSMRIGVPVDLLPALVSRGASVECVDHNGNTPLLLAVQRGNEGIVEFLLAAKASTKVLNKHGVSPLMAAVMDVRGGGGALVERLLEAKAPANGKNKQGKTPLMVAVYHGRQAVVEKLLAAKADVNVRDNANTTAVMLAPRGGSVGVLQLLLAAKADVKLSDKHGNTALLLAARSGSVECVRALLAAKADVGVKNKGGKDAMVLAVGEGVCVLLREHGAKC